VLPAKKTFAGSMVEGLEVNLPTKLDLPR
jgi:hypothetical protein